MHGPDDAARIDVDTRTVEAVAAAVRGPLDDAEHDRDLAVARGGADVVEMPRLDLHRLVDVERVQLLLIGCVEAGTAGSGQPERVARHQRFAKRDQPTTARCGLADPGAHLGHGRAAIQENGRDLRDGDGQGGFGHCEGLSHQRRNVSPPSDTSPPRGTRSEPLTARSTILTAFSGESSGVWHAGYPICTS